MASDHKRGFFGWTWLVLRIVLGLIVAVLVLVPVTQCSLNDYEANKNGNFQSR